MLGFFVARMVIDTLDNTFVQLLAGVMEKSDDGRMTASLLHEAVMTSNNATATARDAVPKVADGCMQRTIQ